MGQLALSTTSFKAARGTFTEKLKQRRIGLNNHICKKVILQDMKLDKVPKTTLKLRRS